MKIAVAGAGIYGATIAIRLAERGHKVDLFDPAGILAAASGINQNRVHSGYHYPRSAETICELLEAREEFLQTFLPAIVSNSLHYYAIPKEGSRVSPQLYERVMGRFGLPLTPCRPDWINFDYVDRCYEVDEKVYDPELLRSLVQCSLTESGIQFRLIAFCPDMK